MMFLQPLPRLLPPMPETTRSKRNQVGDRARYSAPSVAVLVHPVNLKAAVPLVPEDALQEARSGTRKKKDAQLVWPGRTAVYCEPLPSVTPRSAICKPSSSSRSPKLPRSMAARLGVFVGLL